MDQALKKEPLLKLNFLSHGTVECADLTESRRFYEEVLGLEVVQTSKVSFQMRLNSSTTIVCVQTNGDVSAGIFSHFGFDLETVLEDENLTVWQRGDAVHALPETFLKRFGTLPFKSLGLPVGQYTPGGFIPDFDWLSRFETAFTAPRLALPDELTTAWLNGEDLRETDSSGFSSGQVVIMADRENRLMGLGRLLPDRIKNLLPRRALL